MKKFILLFLLFTIHCSFLTVLQAQNPDIKRTWHWYFGNHAGLDFSGGAPIAVTNGQLNSSSCSSISDTSGNLLFYTDGITVWNKNHQIMPNGTGLNGGYDAGRALIVPQPLNDSIYFIFTTHVNPAPYTGFQYSIVDMKLQGGLGDVTVKNDTILKDAWEKLTAVKHANGVDVWIAVSEIYTNKIYCYLLTSAGLDTTPVINSIGHPDNYGASDFKFSQSGKKLAMAVNGDGSEIFDFDNATGILSNPVLFPAGSWQDYGVEFSPDETKLYFSRWFYTPPGKLYQIDLTAGTASAIVNSLTLIDSAYALSGIQRASDGKLYVANYTRPALGVINTPNAAGINCQFDTTGMFLNGKINGWDLPNFISSYFYHSSLDEVINIPARNDNIICYPNPFNYSTNIIIPYPLSISDIEVFDLLGRKTGIKKKITSEIDKTTVTLERNNLPAGIYILQINISDKIYSQKIIITN